MTNDLASPQPEELNLRQAQHPVSIFLSFQRLTDTLINAIIFILDFDRVEYLFRGHFFNNRFLTATFVEERTSACRKEIPVIYLSGPFVSMVLLLDTLDGRNSLSKQKMNSGVLAPSRKWSVSVGFTRNFVPCFFACRSKRPHSRISLLGERQ